MKSWYLVHSKPNQENIANDNLIRQGYETYLPLTSQRRRKSGKVSCQTVPMFPRYLFICLSQDTDDWSPIRSTIGVSSLVRFGQEPASVPESLISQLRSNEDEHGLQLITEKEFEVGDRVRIVEGPFEDHEAIFYAKESSERVLVLLKVLENSVKINLHSSILEKSH